MGITAAIRAIVALIIFLIIVVGIWYIINLKSDLQVARDNQKRLEEAIHVQQDLIDLVKRDIALIQKTNQELNDIAARLRGEAEALSKKFSQDARGQSRDFGTLAKERPELVERLVNRGTRNALRCLELASGAKHTREELEAKTSSEINRECPSIANPNYRPMQ